MLHAYHAFFSLLAYMEWSVKNGGPKVKNRVRLGQGRSTCVKTRRRRTIGANLRVCNEALCPRVWRGVCKSLWFIIIFLVTR